MVQQLPCSPTLVSFCLLLLANAIELSSVMSFRVLLVRSPFVVYCINATESQTAAGERGKRTGNEFVCD